MDDKKQKDYKKPTLLLLLVAAGALVTACAAFSLRQEAAVPAQAGTTQNDMSYYTPKPAASQESPAAQPEPDGPYRVALYEGKIGVFQLGDTKPFLTADVDVYLLPEEDIALLRKGLTAQSLTEVKSILEDYEEVKPAPCRDPGRALAGGKLIYFMPFS